MLVVGLSSALDRLCLDFFFFSSRRRHTRFDCDWSSDVCSSDLALRQRSRLVPAGSLAAECLALERFETARDLHAKALRTEKSKPWHAMRIGLKRFRYTVENLLPEHYAAWGDNLKRLQDMLGEVHDLDVLAEVVRKSDFHETEDSLKLWQEVIERERHE